MPLGSEYRTTWTIQSNQTLNTAIIGRNWRVTDFQQASDTDALRSVALNVIWPLMRPCLPTNVIGLGVAVYFSSQPLIPLVGASISGNGTFPVSQHLPPQVASLIRLKWDATSNRHISKVFLPFVPVCSTIADVNAYMAALTALAPSFLTGQDPFGMPPSTFTGCSWHRASNTSSLLLASEISRKYYTQERRRRNQVPPVDQYPMS